MLIFLLSLYCSSQVENRVNTPHTYKQIHNLCNSVFLHVPTCKHCMCPNERFTTIMKMKWELSGFWLTTPSLACVSLKIKSMGLPGVKLFWSIEQCFLQCRHSLVPMQGLPACFITYSFAYTASDQNWMRGRPDKLYKVSIIIRPNCAWLT